MSVRRTIIDVHTHVSPQYVGLALAVMDRCGIECVITLEMYDGFGETLKRHMEVFNAHPGRFVVFGNVDWSRVNEAGFGESAAARLEEDVASGMTGLKVYKELGLEYRTPNGEFWPVDSREFDPIWAKAGELGIPVLIHTADPSDFWLPVDDDNFWNAVLYGEYAGLTYHGKDFLPYEVLLSQRNELIGRHPGTTFICPHVGNRAADLAGASADLDTFPNIVYDISARIPSLGRSGEHAARSREFTIKYQDRILLGTDIIYDNPSVLTGMQAQCMYQPGEIPLGNDEPEKKYVETTVEFFQSHMDFLMSGRVQTDPPFKRNRQGFTVTGLDLPGEVCEKILYGNVEKIVDVGR